MADGIRYETKTIRRKTEMIKLYAWNQGWVMGLRRGKVVYTQHKEGAKAHDEYHKVLQEATRILGWDCL